MIYHVKHDKLAQVKTAAIQVQNGGHHFDEYLGRPVGKVTTPWTPGRLGKGLLLKDGLHMWATGTPTENWPYKDEAYFDPHHDGIYDHVRGEHDINKSGWHDHYNELNQAPKFYIDDDGTLDMSLAGGHSGDELAPQIAVMHPDLKVRRRFVPSEWKFDSKVSTVLDNTWERGKWGKGLISFEGDAWFWTVNRGGDPHHGEYAHNILGNDNPYDMVQLLVKPNGYVDMYAYPTEGDTGRVKNALKLFGDKWPRYMKPGNINSVYEDNDLNPFALPAAGDWLFNEAHVAGEFVDYDDENHESDLRDKGYKGHHLNHKGQAYPEGNVAHWKVDGRDGHPYHDEFVDSNDIGEDDPDESTRGEIYKNGDYEYYGSGHGLPIAEAQIPSLGKHAPDTDWTFSNTKLAKLDVSTSSRTKVTSHPDSASPFANPVDELKDFVNSIGKVPQPDIQGDVVHGGRGEPASALSAPGGGGRDLDPNSDAGTELQSVSSLRDSRTSAQDRGSKIADALDNGWTPGSWGKAIVFVDGRIKTWTASSSDGDPIHEDMDEGKDWNEYQSLVIDPSGNVSRLLYGGEKSPFSRQEAAAMVARFIGGRVEQQEDGYFDDGDYDSNWTFSRTASEGWTKGQKAKGIFHNGKVMSWLTPDGVSPTHEEMVGSYDDIDWHTAFWIDTDGEIAFWEEPDSTTTDAVFKALPGTYYEYKNVDDVRDDWNFSHVAAQNPLAPPWELGHHGKFFIDGNDQLHHWRTTADDGEDADGHPYHQEVVNAMNFEPFGRDDWGSPKYYQVAGWITPDGKWDTTDINHRDLNRFHNLIRSIPGIKGGNENWTYSKTAFETPSPWTPGGYGKFIVEPTGKVHAWSVDGPDGYPWHSEYADQMGIHDPARFERGGYTYGTIHPSGYVAAHSYANHHPEHMKVVIEQVPGTTTSESNEPDWDFSSSAKVKPWRPGEYGKLLVTPEGEVHHWTCDDHGCPHHDEYASSKGLTRPYKDWLATSQGYLDPDGTLAMSQYCSSPEHEAIARKALPMTHEPEEGWTLSKTAHTIKVVEGSKPGYDTFKGFDERRPMMMNRDHTIVYLGQPGTHHANIEDEFAHDLDSNAYSSVWAGGKIGVTPKEFPSEAHDAVSEHLGIPLTPKDDEWTFSNFTANTEEMDWTFDQGGSEYDSNGAVVTHDNKIHEFSPSEYDSHHDYMQDVGLTPEDVKDYGWIHPDGHYVSLTGNHGEFGDKGVWGHEENWQYYQDHWNPIQSKVGAKRITPKNYLRPAGNQPYKGLVMKDGREYRWGLGGPYYDRTTHAEIMLQEGIEPKDVAQYLDSKSEGQWDFREPEEQQMYIDNAKRYRASAIGDWDFDPKVEGKRIVKLKDGSVVIEDAPVWSHVMLMQQQNVRPEDVADTGWIRDGEQQWDSSWLRNAGNEIKLWLDDVRQPPDNSWTWVETPQEAIALIDNQNVAIASLDYDLGMRDPELFQDYANGLISAEEAELNGMAVVKHMIETGRVPKRVIIHSANPVGAEKMRKALDPLTDVFVNPADEAGWTATGYPPVDVKWAKAPSPNPSIYRQTPTSNSQHSGVAPEPNGSTQGLGVRISHQITWTSGEGKCMVSPEGKVHAWPIDHSGCPHHYQYARNMGFDCEAGWAPKGWAQGWIGKDLDIEGTQAQKDIASKTLGLPLAGVWTFSSQGSNRDRRPSYKRMVTLSEGAYPILSLDFENKERIASEVANGGFKYEVWQDPYETPEDAPREFRVAPPWQPGVMGKYLVSNGKQHLWAINESSEPHHMDTGIHDPWDAHGHIEADGTVVPYDGDPALIAGAHPGLRLRNSENKWKFARVAFDHSLLWTPGQYGRAILTGDGKVYTWDCGPDEWDLWNNDSAFHGEYAYRNGIEYKSGQENMYIKPDGQVTAGSDAAMKKVEGLLPKAEKVDSISENSDDWTFSKAAGINREHHTWKPGTHGKGFMLADGTPVTWTLHEIATGDMQYNGPHHNDVTSLMGLSEEPSEDDQDGDWHSPIYIKPDGTYDKLDYWPTASYQGMQGFEQVGLKQNTDDDWTFAKTAKELRPWQLGEAGRALIDRNGGVYHWSDGKSNWGPDATYHYDGAIELGLGHDNYHAYIRPDGIVDGPDPDSNEVVRKSLPGKPSPEFDEADDWTFSKVATEWDFDEAPESKGWKFLYAHGRVYMLPHPTFHNDVAQKFNLEYERDVDASGVVTPDGGVEFWEYPDADEMTKEVVVDKIAETIPNAHRVEGYDFGYMIAKTAEQLQMDLRPNVEVETEAGRHPVEWHSDDYPLIYDPAYGERGKVYVGYPGGYHWDVTHHHELYDRYHGSDGRRIGPEFGAPARIDKSLVNGRYDPEDGVEWYDHATAYKMTPDERDHIQSVLDRHGMETPGRDADDWRFAAMQSRTPDGCRPWVKGELGRYIVDQSAGVYSWNADDATHEEIMTYYGLDPMDGGYITEDGKKQPWVGQEQNWVLGKRAGMKPPPIADFTKLDREMNFGPYATDPEKVWDALQTGWTPGKEGKGLLTDDGDLFTWNTWDDDGNPHHFAICGVLEAGGIRCRQPGYVEAIYPDGGFEAGLLYQDAIQQQDPRLHSESSDWDYG